MMETVRHFLALIRFSHTLFALPFALLAAMMAWRLEDSGGFTLRALLGILLCMVAARSAAMAFNRLADHRIDATNPRTSNRHLPAGHLTTNQVTLFTAACGLAFPTATLLFLPNRLPLYLSAPVLALLMGYSFAKRFTALAHLWLGTALALSPLAVWIALRGEQVLADPTDLVPPLVLAGAVLTWVTGFDIIYACQDYEFDQAHGLRSVPARYGIGHALLLAAACHAVTVVLLALLPVVFPFLGWVFWAAVALVAVLLVYEHSLVRPDDLDRVNLAFFHVNAVISLGLFAVGALDLWLVGP
jgi:4-hydroxybenzoate polyprenyltransferase